MIPAASIGADARRPTLVLPRGRSASWWGVVWVIITEAMIFAGLLSAYFFIRATSSSWPQGGIEAPPLGRISIFTAVLLASSMPLVYAEHAIRRGRVGVVRVALAANFVMGLAFVVNQWLEYQDLPFGARVNAYTSLFYVITGLHGLHVLAGLVISAVVQLKAALGWFDAERHETIVVFSLYWHFVDAVWVFVFSSLYLSAHWR